MSELTLTPEACRALIDPKWIGKRVAVGMSGGVDSSVAAIILAQAGCEVIGVTMKLWDYESVGGDTQRDGRCCTVEAFSRCRAVADRYNFPHYTLDFCDRFESDVIDYFVQEYRRARTPNPCIVCNSRVRWPALWDKVAPLGCEAIATGHYVRVGTDEHGIDLRRGVDPDRDQSYFLWQVSREDLSRAIFPLGGLHKTRIRALARAWNLPTAETPESRDICFVDDGDLGRFMAERGARDSLGDTSGAIINQNGDVLGQHQGFEAYTIGQRKGLGVAVGRPQYVTEIDPANATVRLGDDADLMATRFTIRGVHRLTDTPSSLADAQVQIRYRHKAAPARVTFGDDGSAQVEFNAPERAITPGQSAVIYREDRVLAGGVIDAVDHK